MATGKRDALGSFLGIAIFLGGVGLLGLTFRLAYDMFTVPPSDALGIKGAKAIDFGVVGNSLTSLIVRILLLIVMGMVGSLIANRGISMYTHSIGMAPAKPKKDQKPEANP